MSTRAGSKQGRPAGRTTTKSSTKDQNKGEKQPPSIIEIVPGRFNEHDWLGLVESEDTEDFIAGIFEDIWTQAAKQIQQIHVQKQLLPFTLMITENALSNVIQVRTKIVASFTTNPFFSGLSSKKTIRSRARGNSGRKIPVRTSSVHAVFLTPCVTSFRTDTMPDGQLGRRCRTSMSRRTTASVCFLAFDRLFIDERVSCDSIDDTTTLRPGRPISAPIRVPTFDNTDGPQRPSTGSSTSSSIQTSNSNGRSRKLPKINESVASQHEVRLDPWTNAGSDEHETSQSSFDRKPYGHDVLVIQTQPPKVNLSARMER